MYQASYGIPLDPSASAASSSVPGSSSLNRAEKHSRPISELDDDEDIQFDLQRLQQQAKREPKKAKKGDVKEASSAEERAKVVKKVTEPPCKCSSFIAASHGID